MKYGSVCSGVEAATVAWHSLGWQPQWFSEIEKFPSAVLKHHYPAVPNHGDMTKFKEWNDDRPIDVLVGGTPCQSFSVAGLRKGLDDPRGNLMLTYLAIAERYAPRWIVWENVPGVLSSNGGRDFGTFLAALGKIGYGFAYRVLDAQYFGVAQRRRRVFVVGYLGDWRRAAAVLFERESMSGHPAPSRETGEEVAGTFKACAGSGGWSNSADHAAAGYMIPVAQCLTTRTGSAYDPTTETLPVTTVALCARTGQSISVQDASQGHLLPIAFGAQNSAQQGDSVSTEVTPTLDKSKTPAIAFDPNQITSKTNRSQPKPECIHTLPATASPPVLFAPQVRRLTPIECERLQGFPDNYTDIRLNDKQTPDGPRYKAMGNSMAVPVMNWIGRRIQMVEEIK
jgi:DNA (cytosine-5)-methyltransferase 1